MIPPRTLTTPAISDLSEKQLQTLPFGSPSTKLECPSLHRNQILWFEENERRFSALFVPSTYIRRLSLMGASVVGRALEHRQLLNHEQCLFPLQWSQSN